VSGVEVEIAVGVPATALPFLPQVGITQLVSSPCLLLGWSGRNPGSTLADYEVLDGTNAMAELQLAGFGVSNQWYGYPGIYCRGGVSINCITGPAIFNIFVVLL
jgi:hypothetical protein